MEDIKNFFDRILITADGTMVHPKTLNTKHIVINVASECGHTNQNYQDLQSFLETVDKNKVTVWLYPSNDFGRQEPGTDEEIKTFCESYGMLDYPNVYLMSKTSLKDSEIWHWLQYTNEGSTEYGYDFEAKWNFFKYLIDENGEMWGLSYSEESLLDKEVMDWVNLPIVTREERHEILSEMVKNDQELGLYDSEGGLIEIEGEIIGEIKKDEQ
jgi:glutathione peroxidase